MYFSVQCSALIQCIAVHLLQCTRLHYSALQHTAVHLLQCTTLHYSAVQCNASLYCSLLHCGEVKCNVVHYCTTVQCNLQLPSQLVNLLLDWTRSSELGNIANLVLLNFCNIKFGKKSCLFGKNYVCLVNL